MKKRDKLGGHRLVQCLAFSLLFLSACGQEMLYSNMNQELANKMMVLLEQHGIRPMLVEETKQNESFWHVKVDRSDLAAARKLIVNSGLVSEGAPGLDAVYRDKGGGTWIKTPSEERARYLLALKGEIINALESLPEVIDADVVLNVPEKARLGSKEQERPTASVIIKAEQPPLGVSALSEITVQQWVANTVEGLAPRDVSVLINFVAPIGTSMKPGDTVTLPTLGGGGESIAGRKENLVYLMGLPMTPQSKNRLKIYLIIFFVVLALLSMALIFSIVQASRTREELKAIKGGERPLALEGEVMEERPRLEAGEEEE